MRITGVEIHDFLSFGSFEWPTLNPSLNVLVGPNGTGKSNLLHAFRMVVDALDSNGERRPAWAAAIRLGALTAAFQISLDLALTTAWDKELLRVFLAASLSNAEDIRFALQQPHPGFNVEHDQLARWATFVLEALKPKSLVCFEHGRLAVSYEQGGWPRAHYTSLPREPDWHWQIFGRSLSSLSRSSDEGGAQNNLFQAWYAHLPTEEQQQLLEFLQGSSADAPVPDVMRLLETLGTNERVQIFARSSPEPSPALRALDRLAETHLNAASRQEACGLANIVALILQRGIVFTDNIRRAPAKVISPERLNSDAPLNQSSGEWLAFDLFLAKMGDERRRQRYSSVQQTFRDLTGTSFEVTLGQLESAAPKATAQPDEAADGLHLDLHVRRGSLETPLAWSGAGIAEALYLSAVLAGNEGRVILLDEPGLSFHPPVLTTLSRMLGTATSVSAASDRAQVILITHSPFLVPVEALTSVSRFALNREGVTIRTAFDTAVLGQQEDAKKKEQFATIQKELRRSSDARGLLFSRAVVLVEGETELGALPAWYENTLEHADVTLYSVGGDLNFATYIRFLHGLGIPYAIICDGSVIGPTQRPRRYLDEQLRGAGVTEVEDMTEFAFDQRRSKLEQFGVFTTAQRADEEFEDLPIIKDSRVAAEQVVGQKSKARIGRHIAETHPCPPEVAMLFARLRAYLSETAGVEVASLST